MEMPEGLLCAELVREFLEFYRMTYSLEIFIPERNLPPEDKLREKIESKLGLKGKAENPTIPVLMQLVQMIQQQSNLNIQNEAPNPSAPMSGEDQTANKAVPAGKAPLPKFAPENLFVYASISNLNRKKAEPVEKLPMTASSDIEKPISDPQSVPSPIAAPKVEEKKIEPKKPDEKKIEPKKPDERRIEPKKPEEKKIEKRPEESASSGLRDLPPIISI
jgi:hypothetical protein